jgi:hypothetical protein
LPMRMTLLTEAMVVLQLADGWVAASLSLSRRPAAGSAL